MTVRIWKGTDAIYWKWWLSIHMSNKETLINWIPKEVSKMLRFLAKMPSSKCNFQRNYLKCGWSVVFCVEGPIPKSNTKLQDELLCSWFSVIIYNTSIYHCYMDLKKWSLFLLVMQDLDSFSFWAGVYLDFFTEFAAFWIPVLRNVQKKIINQMAYKSCFLIEFRLDKVPVLIIASFLTHVLEFHYIKNYVMY